MSAEPGSEKARHIHLTSHPPIADTELLIIHWDAADPLERTVGWDHDQSLATQCHRQSFRFVWHLSCFGRRRPGAAERPSRESDQTRCQPTLSPCPRWFGAERIVSLDLFGAIVADIYRAQVGQGFDLRPTIAATKAHIDLPGICEAIAAGRLKPDSELLLDDGSAVLTTMALEPAWWLPGFEKRFGVEESALRRALFEKPAASTRNWSPAPIWKCSCRRSGAHCIYLRRPESAGESGHHSVLPRAG